MLFEERIVDEGFAKSESQTKVLRRPNRERRFCEERSVDKGFESESWTKVLRRANRGRKFFKERIVDEGFAKRHSWTKIL